MLGEMGKGMSLLLSMDGADDQRMEKVCAIMLGIEKPEMNKPVEINRKEENLRDHHLYWIGRRTQDIVLSLLALVILSPVMLITAFAIVMDDPSASPIFS